MKKYIKYKCISCGAEYNFVDGTDYSKVCSNCGKTLSYWNIFESEEDIPTQQITQINENKKEYDIQDVYQDLHSIKNMMMFFVILTIISMIVEFLFFISIK